MGDRADMPWPPPAISAWVRNRTVSTLRLREELQYWSDWAEKTDESAVHDLYRELR